MKGFGAVVAVILGIVLITVASAIISVQQTPLQPNITPPPGPVLPPPPIPPPPFPTLPSGPSLGGALELLPSVSAQGYQYIYQQAKDTLTVTGIATISTEPNKVDVYLGAETERVTALQSQQDNAVTMQNIRNAITALGIPSDSIETTSFRISVIWDYTSRPYRITGYKTTHLLKITSSDINQAGSIIDAAASAGANVVNNVVFGITKDIRDDLKKQALEMAGQNAREKADSMASGLGVTIVKVVQASEGGVGVVSYYPQFAGGLAAQAEAVPTEISAGDVDVSATISVVYEIS